MSVIFMTVSVVARRVSQILAPWVGNLIDSDFLFIQIN